MHEQRWVLTGISDLTLPPVTTLTMDHGNPAERHSNTWEVWVETGRAREVRSADTACSCPLLCQSFCQQAKEVAFPSSPRCHSCRGTILMAITVPKGVASTASAGIGKHEQKEIPHEHVPQPVQVDQKAKGDNELPNVYMMSNWRKSGLEA